MTRSEAIDRVLTANDPDELETFRVIASSAYKWGRWDAAEAIVALIDACADPECLSCATLYAAAATALQPPDERP